MFLIEWIFLSMFLFISFPSFFFIITGGLGQLGVGLAKLLR